MHEMYAAIELPIDICGYYTTTKDMSPGFQQRHKMLKATWRDKKQATILLSSISKLIEGTICVLPTSLISVFSTNHSAPSFVNPT